MLLDLIVGARPNFIKIAPIIREIRRRTISNLEYRLIHTGQHFDKNMSESFFIQLGIPEPSHNLNISGGTHAEQVGGIMVAYEQILLEKPADLCLVVGDVNSTMACAIAAKKLHIKVAHVEAGIRSGDITMPEEVNRVVTDSISDYFFTTSRSAGKELLRLGIDNAKIFFVGNTMIDTLKHEESRLKEPSFWKEEQLGESDYIVLTLHRPNNVDELDKLKVLISQIVSLASTSKVVFPVHPRTAKNLENISYENLIKVGPLPYLEFNYLVKNSSGIITDSGGITEEATVFGIPCMTMRDNTERPETVDIGTNVLVGTDPQNIRAPLEKMLNKDWKAGQIPELWDGKAAQRIINHLIELSGLSES